MKRIYPDYVYGSGPRSGCWWDDTCDIAETPRLEGDLTCDVAIIGAGFTGLNAAIELASRGVDVAVFDAQSPGWGASGRNGGFCCLGGGNAGNSELDSQYGSAARKEWRRFERDAISHVADLLERTGTDADVHSDGETWLAHKAREMEGLENEAKGLLADYGVEPTIHSAEDLTQIGMSAGFHGGMTLPLGFALNPRKYVAGLLREALRLGVSVFSRAAIGEISKKSGKWHLGCGQHVVSADQVLVATNGYSSDNLPQWLSARYIPTQSSVVVTRPLTQAELEAQGWTSHQMSYDSRNLLHYFRLMPDNRMLFGMRGGLGGSAWTESRAKQRVAKDFATMFPAWKDVELTHYWSGMVCIARNMLPFVGEIPVQPGLWCAMAFHGNGVAMGSYCGVQAARVMLGDDQRPEVVRTPLRRFPLGRWRRALMLPVYAGLMVADL